MSLHLDCLHFVLSFLNLKQYFYLLLATLERRTKYLKNVSELTFSEMEFVYNQEDIIECVDLSEFIMFTTDSEGVLEEEEWSVVSYLIYDRHLAHNVQKYYLPKLKSRKSFIRKVIIQDLEQNGQTVCRITVELGKAVCAG
jgi:hypothetical protein